MELIPAIRKYYSFNGIKAVGEPSKIKSHWLTIIKHLIKKYNMVSLDYHFTVEGQHIRRQKYCFCSI
jgi:hypothetical protein